MMIPFIHTAAPRGLAAFEHSRAGKAVVFFWLCLFFLGGGGAGYAQHSDLYFEQISYDDSLSPSMISSIVQDEKGFIWIGTENGLLRYDGYDFVKHTRDRQVAGSISNNHVNIIYEDSDTNLWIGTSNGVNHFNKDTKIFTPIDIQPIKGGRNYITSFMEDEQKNIWVGTFGGVRKLNRERKTLDGLQTSSNVELFHTARVLSLFPGRSLGVLVGTSVGLRCFESSTGEEKELPRGIQASPVLLESKIWKMAQEENGDLWFATKTQGAFWYSKERDVVTHFRKGDNRQESIASNWVYDIAPVDENTIWFATIDGVSVYHKDSDEFATYRHNALSRYCLSDNEIKSFLKDRNGSIWVGTTAGGLNFFNQSNNNFINIGETVQPNFGLTNPIINALVKDGDESIWVGTNGGGLNYLNLQTKKSASYKIEALDKMNANNIITALAQEGDGNLLCGTLNGVYRFRKRSRTFQHLPISEDRISLVEYPITSLLVSDRDIWMGTEGDGLACLLPDGRIINYRATGEAQALSDNFVTDLKSFGNFIWVATQNGLTVIDKQAGQVVNSYRSEGEGTISNNNLTTLFIDSRQRLWVGTDYGGLSFLEEGSQRFHVLNKAKGLTDNSIKSISEDAEGNIWVSSDDLLFKVSVGNLPEGTEDPEVEITSYSSNDGLSLGRFSNNCSIRLTNNKLIFGTSKGLILFQADGILKSPNTSEIVLTSLKVHNKEVRTTDPGSPLQQDIANTSEIELLHDQGYLEIGFSAMNFVNPENNKYAYQLLGPYENEEWHVIGSQNSVSFTNLSHGSYLFRVKTSGADNIWSEEISTLAINILPPWWKSWWAYGIYSVLFLTLTFVIIRFVNIRIQLKRALFVEHVEKERQQELYQMKLDFFTNVSHEIRTPLSLMVAPIEDLLEIVEPNTKVEKRLRTIKNNSDRLLKLVNELLDFRKAENGLLKIYCKKQDIVSFCFEVYESFKGLSVEKNIEYKFVIDSNFIPVYFDKYQMEKVLYNLLSNAFKFTRDHGKIVLSVEGDNQEEGWVHIKIEDNGIGIPAHSQKNIFQRFFQIEGRGYQNTGTGVGLALSKNIIELHKGQIEIVDQKNAWSTTSFQISLQLGSSHLAKAQLVEEAAVPGNEFFAEGKEVPAMLPEQEKEAPPIVPEEEPLPLLEKSLDSSKKTILLVEDNEEFREYIREILEEEYNILEFANGKAALLHMEKEIPDLIISDVMMPEMDGLELCEIVKTNETTNHIPIILLTAKSSTDSEIEGLANGADSYITKPFSTKILKLNIVNLLSAKEILRHKFSGNFIIDADLKKLSTPEELFLKKLLEVIESNMENPEFNVSELVREIGMSRTILYKKVNALTNHSIATLIKHVRLKKATDILLKTSYSVFDVATMVGFNDRKHFSKEFKKVYNLSPTDYRNANTPVQDPV